MKKIIILFATILYPILYLFSYNIQQLNLKELIIPIILVISFYTLVCLTLIILKRPYKKVVYLIFLLNFFSLLYGSIIQKIEEKTGQLHYLRELQIIFFLLIIIYFLYKKNINQLYIFIKIFLIIIYIFIFFTLIHNIVLNIDNSVNINKNLSSNNNQLKNKVYPDIYFIILDEYASTKTINKEYKYDNNDFEKSLLNRNFNIFSNSITNYNDTWKVLASILNMNNINNNVVHNDLYNIILNNNKVIKTLKYLGYKYVYISDQTLYNGTYLNPYSNYSFYDFKKDRNFSISSLDKFTIFVLKNSFLKFLLKNNNVNRENEILKYKMLQSVVNKYKSPKYVFLHSMITHQPYLFDKYGNYITSSKQNTWTDKQIYLNSYIFSNKTILNSIDTILNKNKNCIIIIQSDHGPRYKKYGNQWKSIFNTIYLPNSKGNVIKTYFNNIDTFKYIFNYIKT